VREEFGIPLAPMTTMRVGGPARRLVTAETADELVDAVRDADAAGDPCFVLGGGSNVVIADPGFAGTVVRVATRGISVESADYCGGVTVRVAAGEPWDPFVEYAIAHGWAGIEALSGIPGTVGATPVQNVGAYGQEVGQTVAQVRTWDRQAANVVTFANAECAFGYRSSRFKRATTSGRGRYVVIDVVFQLEIADLAGPVGYADLATGLGVGVGVRVPLAELRQAVLAQRRRRGMVLDDDDHDTWSCGSFFTNPLLSQGEYDVLCGRVVARTGTAAVPPRYPAGDGTVKTSAAWLIERAGFDKGFGMPGPVALSSKHTLAVTNRGSASAADVLRLASTVRDGVRDAFGVTLELEPNLVGWT